MTTMTEPSLASEISVPSVPKDSWRGWAVVGAACVGLLFNVGVLVLYSFGVVTSSMAADFGWSVVERSALFVSFSICVAVSGPLWGILADRIGARRVIVISTILLAGSFASLAIIPGSLLLAHLIFALIGVLGSGTLPPIYANLVVGWFDRSRGLALGISMMGIGLGASILPPVAASIVTHLGWREMCVAYGLMVLLISRPCALLFLRAHPDQLLRTKEAGHSVRVTVTRAFGQSHTWVLAIFALITGVILVASVTSFVPMLQSRGETVVRAAQFQSILGISLLAGRLIGGALFDRIFAPRVVTAILLITACGFLVLAQASTPAAYALAAIGIGAAIGLEIDFLAFIVSRYYDRIAYATICSLFFAIYCIGSTAGPSLFAWLLQYSGDHGLGLRLFAALTFLLALSMFMLPRYEARK